MYNLMAPAGTWTLRQLAERLGVAAPAGHDDKTIEDVKPLERAGAAHISVLSNDAYAGAAKETKAGVVLVNEAQKGVLPAGVIAWVVPQPYVAFAKVLQVFYPTLPVTGGVAGTASVSASAQVDPTARIEPGAVVYAGASIAAGAHIGAHTVIGHGVAIGARTMVGPHGSIFKATIGEDCILHPGVRIGQDGFGFALDGTSLIKVPQVGGVRIGKRVEIGANVTIDCGALDDTEIFDDAKLDNQVQIGHNVKIGQSTRIVAQSGVAGSTVLGAFNLIGGQSGIAGHLTTAPGVALAARSGLTKDVTEKGAVLAGMPAVPIMQWRKTVAAIARLVKKGGDAQPAAEGPNKLVVRDAAALLEKKRAKAASEKAGVAVTLDDEGSPF